MAFGRLRGYALPMHGDLSSIAFETVRAHGMFAPEAPVVAMVSGGADSVALLRLLADGTLGPTGPLSVLHVDHGLRGADSAADADFVAALCDALGVECRVVRCDVTAFAREEGLNLEDAGRRVRYRHAEEEADTLCADTGVPAGCGRITTAHTLDDHVETVLMRLVTGTGARGLAGIRPVRGRIVRPLVRARRSDVVAYLESLGQPWREDATNADTSRLRARIRHEVVPVLEDVNPGFAGSVLRLTDVLTEEDALLDEMAGAFARDFDVSAGEGVALDLALFGTLGRPMARRVLRKAVTDAFPEASRLEFEHVEAILDGMAAEGFTRDITGGLRASSECGRITVSRGEEELVRFGSALLEVPGSADLGLAGWMDARIVGRTEVPAGPNVAALDADAIGGPLTVTPPRPGDRMRPLGMSGTKKLSDLFIDAKVPVRERAAVPVVREGDRIVWAAGVRLSEDHKVTQDTERMLVLTWSRE